MRIVILGNGGHARVVESVLRAGWYGPGVEYVRTTTDDVPPWDKVAIGIGDIDIREDLFEKYPDAINVLDKTALIRGELVGNGIQVMAGAIIQVGTRVYENTLINTGARIDHDCTINSHCHIAPGAILCGGVVVEGGSFIGAGAVIAEGVTIYVNSFIPAGSVVGKRTCQKQRL